MNPLKAVLGLIVLQDDDPATVAANDDIVLIASSEPETHETPDHPKDLGGEQGVDLASVGVRSEHLQDLASADHDLLQLGAGELAMHAVRDASGTLQGQVVEVHGGASKASRLCKTSKGSLGVLEKSPKDFGRSKNVENI